MTYLANSFRYALVLVLGLFFFQGCSDNQAGGPKGGNAIPGWKLFQRPFFSIQYPPNWQLDSTTTAAQFFLYAPPDSDPDPYRESIHLVVQEMAGLNYDLNKYVAICETQIKSELTEGSLIESRRITDKESKYHLLTYETTKDNMRLKLFSYTWVVYEKAFLLTLTCKKENYDSTINTAKKIMNSFVLHI